jgi:hypothetical protein
VIKKKTKKALLVYVITAIGLCLLILVCANALIKSSPEVREITYLAQSISYQTLYRILPGSPGSARIAGSYPAAQRISKKWSSDARLVSIGFTNELAFFLYDPYKPSSIFFAFHSSRKDKDLIVWTRQQFLSRDTEKAERSGKEINPKSLSQYAWVDIFQSQNLQDILVGKSARPLQSIDPTLTKIDLVDVVHKANDVVPTEFKGNGAVGENVMISVLLRPRGQGPRWYVGYLFHPYDDAQFTYSFVFDASTGRLIEKRNLRDNLPSPLKDTNAQQ